MILLLRVGTLYLVKYFGGEITSKDHSDFSILRHFSKYTLTVFPLEIERFTPSCTVL